MRLKRAGFVLASLLSFASTTPSMGAADKESCLNALFMDAENTISVCTNFLESREEKSKADLADAYFNRGAAHLFAGDHDSAILDLSEALKAAPARTDYLLMRGGVWLLRNLPDPAIRDFDEAIRREPANAAAFASRSSAYIMKGDLDRAIVDATEAIRLDPNAIEALQNRARAHFDKGAFGAAAADFEAALRLAPDSRKAGLREELEKAKAAAKRPPQTS